MYFRQNDRVKVVSNTTNHPFYVGERVYLISSSLQFEDMYDGKVFYHAEGRGNRTGDIIEKDLAPTTN